MRNVQLQPWAITILGNIIAGIVVAVVIAKYVYKRERG